MCLHCALERLAEFLELFFEFPRSADFVPSLHLVDLLLLLLDHPVLALVVLLQPFHLAREPSFARRVCTRHRAERLSHAHRREVSFEALFPCLEPRDLLHGTHEKRAVHAILRLLDFRDILAARLEVWDVPLEHASECGILREHRFPFPRVRVDEFLEVSLLVELDAVARLGTHLDVRLLESEFVDGWRPLGCVPRRVDLEHALRCEVEVPARFAHRVEHAVLERVFDRARLRRECEPIKRVFDFVVELGIRSRAPCAPAAALRVAAHSASVVTEYQLR
mmetsp:Transcript_1648/g.4404  ORF Transcript_1648/g.4404 Transcript_1648/m.4404 type:complete len:279 (+) Transcript_1648:360-1196(+)